MSSKFILPDLRKLHTQTSSSLTLNFGRSSISEPTSTPVPEDEEYIIFNGCEVRTEISVTIVTIRHHETCIQNVDRATKNVFLLIVRELTI